MKANFLIGRDTPTWTTSRFLREWQRWWWTGLPFKVLLILIRVENNMPVALGQPSIPSPLSWNLTIDSTTLVVTGSMSIGTVMVQLVNRLGRWHDLRSLIIFFSFSLEDISEDFSDHALWWPKANMWLTNTKWTLDQYGVQSDAQLAFTSMHKSIRCQLPDLRILSTRVDFSVSVYASVCKLCQDLGRSIDSPSTHDECIDSVFAL